MVQKLGTKAKADPLAPENKWVEAFDVVGFKQEIQDLGARLSANQGPDDVAHMNKIILWSNICTVGGVLSAGLSPTYVFPSVLLAVGIFARWTMVAHHTCHGGYDKLPIQGGRFNRFKFAVGSTYRRALDWFDWMLPEAWNVEHNNLHHYHLGEESDPDLVERNMAMIREADMPMWQKYTAVTFMAATWKWFYYSPNTFKELKIKELRRKGIKAVPVDHANPGSPWQLTDAVSWQGMLMTAYLPSWFSLSEYVVRVFAPYVIYRFVLLPLPWLFVGQHYGKGSTYFMNAVINAVVADIVTNLHGFLCIVTNHAGNDLYRFEKHCRPRSGEFYLRQVISSADFAAGDDVTDFLHGWLNYQIEHHLWPDLSMLSYQRSMPEVKKICKKYGVPYIQESVWIRLKKTVDIMVGADSMRRYPIEFENPIADARTVGEKVA